MGKDRPKAIAAFEQAVAIDSFNTDALNSLALGYASLRRYERADPDLQPKVAEVRARMERLLKTLPR